jgi:serralysin
MPQPGTYHDVAHVIATGAPPGRGGTIQAWDTSADNIITVNIADLGAAEQALARAAMQAWEMVADIDFRETTGQADILFENDGGGVPFARTTFTTEGEIVSSFIYVPTSWMAPLGLAVGSFAFHTYLHELGHALGLEHPSTEYDYGGSTTYPEDAIYQLDSWQASVLSYFNQTENTDVHASHAFCVTPMMSDIIAVQMLYGAPSGGPTAGNTIWGRNSDLGTYIDGFFRGSAGSLAANTLVIFDESGTDLLDLSHDARAQTVNLNGGNFSNVFGLTGNLGIAIGTVIENLRSGGGDDRVTGNGAANRIETGAGADSVDGGSGNDTLFGGNGHDVLRGSAGLDRAEGGEGNDTLLGGDGNDTLLGQAGADRIEGGAGADRIEGGGGGDSLFGLDGHDTIFGGAGDDRLEGNAGNDRLSGGGGSDRLVGGDGADTFVFDGGVDRIRDFQHGRDALAFDDALWGGGAISDSRLLGFAEVKGGDTVFDFGTGRKLVIENFTDIAALADDIAIV